MGWGTTSPVICTCSRASLIESLCADSTRICASPKKITLPAFGGSDTLRIATLPLLPDGVRSFASAPVCAHGIAHRRLRRFFISEQKKTHVTDDVSPVAWRGPTILTASCSLYQGDTFFVLVLSRSSACNNKRPHCRPAEISWACSPVMKRIPLFRQLLLGTGHFYF